MISVGEALAQVCAAATALGGERVTLREALGRVALEDTVSTREVPSAANSAMDGYAVRHADLAASPAALRIVAVRPAGTVTETRVDAGTAVKLFTGSVIPGGADTVVRVEDTEEHDRTVRVHVAPARGANIRNAGEDIRPGQVVLAAGTLIGPADVGLLASIGRATVLVHRRPQVAILSTGTELVEVDEPPGPGQVVNSNAYALAAAVRDAGGEPVVLPLVGDRSADIGAALAGALRADVVLSSGGVSVGDLDFVKGALEGLGVERVFWRVAQKPGKPLLFCRAGHRLVFGLPGNPVSALVCFWVYVWPALRRLQGHRHVHLPVVQAALARGIRKASGLTEFVRVRLREGAEGYVADPLPAQGSHVLSALGNGAALLVGPSERSELAADERFPVLVPAPESFARERAPF
jgi:molybdopterin molybdotransferase